ncbi:MAG: hypothetical protein D3910_12715, partial [Candidatus Electrothrix sp. ATG2]|nr:hypothetical protein [Candidatus Electrothrix sp. ATG2]
GQADRHLVRINLPFGYPHFPPTVKPLTPIFHPDIDPDAVRIASHWQQDPSLTALIIHIAEMICANNYNLDEPFNQEAADWYSDHSSDFPLDEIQQGEADFEVGDLSMEEDNDLGLSVELDTPKENIEEQLEEIQHHIDRNEVVTAGKLLTALSSSSPEAQQLKKIVSSALAKRDKLFQELEELENEDNFTEAYEVFEKIQKIAIDTPALSDVGQRLQQSQAMLDTFSLPDSTADEQEPTASKDKQAKETAKKKKTAEKTKQKEKIPKKEKASSPPIKIPVKPILRGLVFLAVTGGATLLFINNMEKMTETERNWIEIKYQRCATPDQFNQKRIQAEKLLISLKSIYFPGLGKKNLATEIQNHINSPDFKKGEAGDMEYKGSSLQAPVIKRLEPVDNKIDQAAAAARKEKFTEALSLYQEALSLAETAKPGAVDPHAKTITKELNKRIPFINEKITEFQGQAGQEEKQKERRQAEKNYMQSIVFFKKLKEQKFNPSERQGNLKTDDLWGECIERLQNAEKLLREYPEINLPERQKKIKTSLAYSRLYQELEAARQAYEEGEFVTAINEYQRALGLLEENRSDLNAIYNDAILKVGRTVVMLTVSLELQKAVEAENRNDLSTSLKHYKKIIRTIRTSQVDKDYNLKKLEQYIRTKINEQSLQAAKSSNQEWWKKNYERIFKKEFPASRNALLSNPLNFSLAGS